MTDRRLRFIRGEQDEAGAILAALDERTIDIALPEPPVPHATQLLAIAATDLLGRLFPRISFSCPREEPASAALPPGPPTLLERLEEARRTGIAPLDPGEPYTRLALGAAGSEADLYADGHGWQSYLGTEPSNLLPAGEEDNPIGPLCAASRLGAHAFRHQLAAELGDLPAARSTYFSALDYQAANEPLPAAREALPRSLHAVLVGAGSVGGAIVYALARVPGLIGELDIVDPQRLQPGNPDRAILATVAQATAEEWKAAVAVAALVHQDGLFARPYESDVAAFVAGRERKRPLPLCVCGVDSPESRRSLQDCLPLDLVNAACAPREVMISGHRTGAGPCLCCLQMEEALDTGNIRYRMIARESGLNEQMVLQLMIQPVPLDAAHLAHIERHRGLAAGALGAYAGRTLTELWEAELLYGESRLKQGESTVAVAAPWITSLAGFLAAGEALKHGDPTLASFRLGPGGLAIKWEEGVYGSPADGMLTSPPRWRSNECLCRSPRRRRILIERHGLDEDEYPA